MTDYRLHGSKHDLIITDNDIEITRSYSENIAQGIKIRMLMFIGEWHLDKSIGFPYYELILGRKVDTSLIIGIFSTEIVKEKGVRQVENLTFDFTSDRNLAISFKAILEDDTTLTQTIQIEG